MWPTVMMIGDRPLISWTVLALVGGWAAYFSLRASLRRARVPSGQITVFFLGAVAAWFVSAYLAHGWTVGRQPSENSLFAGYVLYGGVFGTFAYGLAAWFVLGWRRWLPVESLWDEGALALAWALFFGRIGCTLYGCCYGSPSHGFPGYELSEAHWDYANRSFPAGLQGVKLHFATLYEAAGLLAIVAGSYAMRGRSLPPGVRGWYCWIAYAATRFLCEFLRGDPRGSALFGLSPSQWASLALIGAGAALLPGLWRRPRVAARAMRSA